MLDVSPIKLTTIFAEDKVSIRLHKEDRRMWNESKYRDRFRF